LNIAILGGGIGALSTAITLKQAGFDVEVYERHSGPAEIGAGIVCWPNASFVLEQLGVLDDVVEVSGSLNFMNRFSSSGESIGSLDINELSRLMNYPSYSIIRKNLMAILTQRTLVLDIPIHYQHDVMSLSGFNDKASVQFSNGITIDPEIIIGADGRMNSLARKYVNQDNKPIYQGFINWVGVFESEIDIFSDISVADYWGTGERFGIVPVSTTKAYWAGGAVAEKIADIDPKMYKAELNTLFADWPRY